MAESLLCVEDNFRGRGDDFYEALIRAHEGLSDAESHTLNARLVLILANHIGDLTALQEALAVARRCVEPGRQRTVANENEKSPPDLEAVAGRPRA